MIEEKTCQFWRLRVQTQRILRITRIAFFFEEVQQKSYSDRIFNEFELSGEYDDYEGILVYYKYASEGLLLVANTLDVNAIVVVDYNDVSYNYSINKEVQFEILPLPMGAGSYDVTCGYKTDKKTLRVLGRTQVTVESSDDVFLNPNYMCYYNDSSECVLLANSLCSGIYEDEIVVDTIVKYLAETLKYGKGLTSTELSSRDPDQILSDGYGVCADFSSLAAAMLRSQGIPTKIVWGYNGTLYHAWNECFLNGEWVLIDLTYMNQCSDYGYSNPGVEYAVYKYY